MKKILGFIFVFFVLQATAADHPENFVLYRCGEHIYHCPQKECAWDELLDDNGKCFKCDTEEMVSVNCIGKDIAKKICPNRKICATTERYAMNGAIGSFLKHNDKCYNPGSFMMRFRCR